MVNRYIDVHYLSSIFFKASRKGAKTYSSHLAYVAHCPNVQVSEMQSEIARLRAESTAAANTRDANLAQVTSGLYILQRFCSVFVFDVTGFWFHHADTYIHMHTCITLV